MNTPTQEQPKSILAVGAVERIIAAVGTDAILAEARRTGARGCERNEVEERVLQIVTSALRVSLFEDRAKDLAEREKARRKWEGVRKAEKKRLARLYKERTA